VLEERCRQDLARRVRGKDKPKGELLADERGALRPLPASEFEPRRVEFADANSLSLVRFDGNDYSVPTAYAHHPITIVGGLDEVRLVCRDRLVARHRRHWGKEHVTFDPVHYLALLERKPGAFDYARPLVGLTLPADFAVLRRRFEAAWGKPGCGTSSRFCGCWRSVRRASWRRPSAGRWRSGRPPRTPSGCCWR
jgi:hypothetical protein